MCDFKPGDEVVCVDADQSSSPVVSDFWNPVMQGATYTVREVGPNPSGRIVVFLAGHSNPSRTLQIDYGYSPSRFRKVQRRDLTAWLATKNTIEDPKRNKVTA